MSLGDASKVHIQHFALFRDQTVPLSPFMVFVGRNDTGKTMLLRALDNILIPVPRNRTGTWVPTPNVAEELAEEIRFALRDAEPDEIHVYGRDQDAGVRLDSGERPRSRPQVPAPLDERLSAPVGDVVWLDFGDLGSPVDTVERFLTGTDQLPDKLVAAADEATTGDDDAEPLWPARVLAQGGPDTAHALLFDVAPGGRSITVRPWVEDALRALSETAYELLPAFARRYYDRVVIEMTTDPPFARWSYRVALEPRDDYMGRPFELEELASGVRAWLTLAVGEAVRRLLTRQVRLTEDSFTLPERPAGERARVLYLADEPERHLHPEAQREAARWLLERLDDQDTEAGVAIATHSPAFVDLPRGRRTLYLCERDEDGTAATVTTWPGEDLENLHDLAAHSGLTLSDVFLSASVVLLVEGKTDAAYVPAVWRLLFGTAPAADGVRVVPVGGVDQARYLIGALFDKLYERPVHYLVDNPAFDQAHRKQQYDDLEQDYDVTVHAHDRFDAWALIPERIAERLPGLDRKHLLTQLRKDLGVRDVPPDWWRALEQRRAKLLEQQQKQRTGSPPALPNATKLLKEARTDRDVDLDDQFREALTLLAREWQQPTAGTTTLVGERVRAILEEVRDDALHRPPWDA